jgi:hypothetical protein
LPPDSPQAAGNPPADEFASGAHAI